MKIVAGGTGIVEMLFCTSLVALVGAGEHPAFSPRQLQIINTKVNGHYFVSHQIWPCVSCRDKLRFVSYHSPPPFLLLKWTEEDLLSYSRNKFSYMISAIWSFCILSIRTPTHKVCCLMKMKDRKDTNALCKLFVPYLLPVKTVISLILLVLQLHHSHLAGNHPIHFTHQVM